MYKISNGMLPEYVLQYFEEFVTNYFLRNSMKKFVLCKVKTKVGKELIPLEESRVGIS